MRYLLIVCCLLGCGRGDVRLEEETPPEEEISSADAGSVTTPARDAGVTARDAGRSVADAGTLPQSDAGIARDAGECPERDKDQGRHDGDDHKRFCRTDFD